ncbi:MAG TPA: hypothetical protein VN802_21245 [Stellaceae bacterium]|nr:hypothetical protein [Stellaceae bacterium]
MAYKVVRRRGRLAEDIEGAPFFESWDEAASWAAEYAARADFRPGLESVDVCLVFGNAKRVMESADT